MLLRVLHDKHIHRRKVWANGAGRWKEIWSVTYLPIANFTTYYRMRVIKLTQLSWTNHVRSLLFLQHRLPRFSPWVTERISIGWCALSIPLSLGMQCCRGDLPTHATHYSPGARAKNILESSVRYSTGIIGPRLLENIRRYRELSDIGPAPELLY